VASSILAMDTELGIGITDVCAFVVPFNNEIYILDSGKVSMDTSKPKFYGDTMSMSDWASLKLIFGTVTLGMTIYTLEAGYSYEFNTSTKIFKIYDAINTLVIERDNIVSIADLGIDFTISNSHQFKVMETFSVGGMGFLRQAGFDKMGGNFYTNYALLNGINDNYIPRTDASSPFNPQAGNYGRLGDIQSFLFNKIEFSFVLYLLAINTGINKFSSNLTMDSKYPFYYNGLTIINGEGTQLASTGAKVNLDSFVLPALAISMFPYLLPVKKSGEVLNNRPTYEPWMIWGFYKLLYNQITNDNPDTYSIEILSLSPNWGG
jgi:hypothetical protein